MSLVDKDILIEKARKLAFDFKRNTGETLPIGRNIARYDMEKYLPVKLINSDRLHDIGFDAMGLGELENNKILMKSKVIQDPQKSYKLGSVSLRNNAWNYLALIIYNLNYQPKQIYGMSRCDFIKIYKKNSKYSCSINKFIINAKILWNQNNLLS